MGKPRPAHVTVLGDVNLEVTGTMNQRFRDLTTSQLISAPLTVRVGGTAANFAIAAASRFEKVRLLGAIGTDRQGKWIESSLRSLGIDTRLHRSQDHPTGTVLAIREGGTNQGSRLMIASPHSANDTLTKAHLQQHKDCLDVHILVADGYSLLREPRRSTVLSAMKRARTAGAQVILDLVPHHVHQLINRVELQTWLKHVSIIVTEVLTARALLHLQPHNETADIHDAIETAVHLDRAFPGRSLMLRFGAHNIDESLVWRSADRWVHRHTGFTQAATTHGFGDRLTAEEVSRYFADCLLEQACEPR